MMFEDFKANWKFIIIMIEGFIDKSEFFQILKAKEGDVLELYDRRLVDWSVDYDYQHRKGQPGRVFCAVV